MASAEEFRKHIDHIRKVLADAQRDVANGKITKEFINTYIDRILVTPEGDDTARLDIKIFTGERTEKYLKKLARHSGHITPDLAADQETPVAARDSKPPVPAGHTFKKMIESYEQGMK